MNFLILYFFLFSSLEPFSFVEFIRLFSIDLILQNQQQGVSLCQRTERHVLLSFVQEAHVGRQLIWKPY